MGDIKLLKAGKIWSIERYSGAAAGDLVDYDNNKVDAIADPPKGFLVDDLTTDNPPLMLNVYGEGSHIDLSGVLTAGAVGALIYSDGDGTVSSTEPAGAAGTQVWVVGFIIGDEDAGTSTILEVRMQLYEKGAA